MRLQPTRQMNGQLVASESLSADDPNGRDGRDTTCLRWEAPIHGEMANGVRHRRDQQQSQLLNNPQGLLDHSI